MSTGPAASSQQEARLDRGLDGSSVSVPHRARGYSAMRSKRRRFAACPREGAATGSASVSHVRGLSRCCGYVEANEDESSGVPSSVGEPTIRESSPRADSLPGLVATGGGCEHGGSITGRDQTSGADTQHGT
jgi:hypothetical protein